MVPPYEPTRPPLQRFGSRPLCSARSPNSLGRIAPFPGIVVVWYTRTSFLVRESMDPTSLRDQALRLRRLARELNDEAGRAALMAMAEECEAKEAEREGTPVHIITYEVTATGPKGYQVMANSPELRGLIVDNFCSEATAASFAERMRQIDADPSHAAARAAP